MKHLAVVIICSLSVVFFAACKTTPTAPLAPDTDAAALWEYITTTADYTTWHPLIAGGGLLKAAPPHGPLVKIYVNQIARDSQYKADPDSILVMESYDTKQTLLNITLMQKRKEYAPSSGNWFWARYEPNGAVVEEGKIRECIECHVSTAYDDYTFVHQW